MRVLPAGRLRREEGAQRLSVRLRRVLPVGPDRGPAVTETLLVGVAVLGNDGGYPLRVADSEPEARWCAVVKDVHRKPVEADDLGKSVDHVGDVVERVFEFFPRRHVGLTEPGKVRGDHMKSVGEQRDQVAKHVARTREAVQQQQLRGICWSRLAIKDFETVNMGRAISDRRHENLLYL